MKDVFMDFLTNFAKTGYLKFRKGLPRFSALLFALEKIETGRF